MRVLCSTAGLGGRGGSETYLITVADHLQRLGHDVWLHALETGEVADDARALGLRVTTALQDVGVPDVALVQDGAVAFTIAAALPGVPQVFVAHSDVFDLQLPPQLRGVVSAVITLYARVDERVRAMAATAPVTCLTQPVDTERFKPVRALPERPRVAVALGNYVHTDRLDHLRSACASAGIELRHVGSYDPGGSRPAEVVLAEADIVFGKSRVIVEAMACGCAAYIYDFNGAEGWVTPERYALLAHDNFAGHADPIGIERVAADLAAYDPAMGVANRDLAVTHHAATRHVAALVPVLQGAAPGAVHAGAPLDELARLVRLYHRADARAFLVQGQQAVTDARRAEAERERDEARAALDEARAEASRASDALEAVRGSRRWQLVQSVMAPLDVARGRRPGRVRPPRAAGPPAPFIVGVGRSGTTLLRLMLDAHPQLAIPPETGWGIALADPAAAEGPEAFLALVRAIETWPDLDLDHDAVLDRLRRVTPWTPGEGTRELYRAYTERQDKPRWGDKTPGHVTLMPQIAAALPEARFVHLVRDGRDVAASVRSLPFAPGDGSLGAAAADWVDRIRGARAAAAAVQHYRELRFEDLVADPERALRDLCEWLQLPWDPALMRAHERAAARLDELPVARESASGTVTREERQAWFQHVTQPPDPSRVGRWQVLLEPAEQQEIDAIAGPLLAELGYA